MPKDAGIEHEGLIAISEQDRTRTADLAQKFRPVHAGPADDGIEAFFRRRTDGRA